MSDNNEVTTPEIEQGHEESPEPENQEQESTPKPQGTDWKAEARKWESRAKDNQSELAEKDQKLTEALEKVGIFEAREKQSNIRIEVADELRIPVKTLAGVSGETFEEIKANAETLLSLGKRSPHVTNIGDPPKAKRTTAEIFADHVRSQI